MKRILIPIILFLFVSLAACKKFLEEENKSNVVAEEYYTTGGYEKLVNAAYSTLRTVYSQPWLFTAGTDMYVEGRTEQPEGISEYRNLTPDDANVRDFYANVYKSIQVCNTALYFNDKTEKAPNLSFRKGEMQFLRAYYYFLLVQTFGGVSIVTDRFDAPVEEFRRNSAQEVYDFILSEMTQALTLVPETTADFGRVTKRAIRHYLAKVHLTRGYESFGNAQDFQTAATYADAAINGQALSTSFEDLFFPGNEKNPEILFSIQYDAASLPTSTSGGNPQANYFGPNMGAQGAVQGYPSRAYLLVPTMYVFDVFTPQDARFDATFMIYYYQRYYDYYDKKNERATLNIKYYYKPKWDTQTDSAWRAADPARRNNTIIIPYSPAWQAGSNSADNATPAVKKFDDPKSSFGQSTSTRDFFLARLGETYLIAAEAYFKSGNLPLAVQRINEVRRRAAKPGQQAAMMITASTLTLDFILDERARELVGEYHRWFDLKRTGTLMQRTKVHNRDIKSWFTLGIDPFLGTNGAFKILRPIPNAALDLNRAGVEQNPGY